MHANGTVSCASLVWRDNGRYFARIQTSCSMSLHGFQNNLESFRYGVHRSVVELVQAVEQGDDENATEAILALVP